MRGPGLLAAGLAAIVVLGALAWLGTHGSEVAGSNGIPARSFVVGLEPGGRVCTPVQRIPQRADRLQFVVGTSDGGPARVEVIGRREASVAVRGGGRVAAGLARVPIRVTASSAPVELCIVNRGRRGIVLSGAEGDPAGTRVTPPRGPLRGVVALNYLDEDPPSWLSQASTIADRFRRVRVDPFGAATLWVALALAVAAVAIGTAVTARDSRGA